jgi:hypothetical protein
MAERLRVEIRPNVMLDFYVSPSHRALRHVRIPVRPPLAELDANTAIVNPIQRWARFLEALSESQEPVPERQDSF